MYYLWRISHICTDLLCFCRMLKYKVFVYGTLKSGQPFNHIITDGSRGNSKLLGIARTEAKWPLVIANIYNIPYLLDGQGIGKVTENLDNPGCWCT